LPVLKVACLRGHNCSVWICGGDHDHMQSHRNVVDDCANLDGQISIVYLSPDPSPLPQVDWAILNGDRYPLLPIVVRCYQQKIGIVHMSGGDKQDGFLVDEPVRHAISKFAHLHFPILQSSYGRLIRMGEQHKRIHNVGSTMVDDLVNFRPVKNNFNGYFLIQMHPAPNWTEHLRDIILILKGKADIIVMMPNGDPGFGETKGITWQKSLPREEFLQLMWNARCFIGNSSGMALEAQYIGVPCVHVGPRNDGREEAFPGHQVEYEGDILRAVDDAIGKDARNIDGLRHDWRDGKHGDGTAAQQIIDCLEKTGVPTQTILHKEWE